MSVVSFVRRLLVAALLVPAVALPVACANGGTVESETDGDGNEPGSDPQGGGDFGDVCLLHTCDDDAECAGCTEGRTTCLVEEHRCVACDAATGGGCPNGQTCSSWGNCVPDGLTCPTDGAGTPTITCAASADCAACDPMHRVCDTAAGACVACTTSDTSECQPSDICVHDQCSPKCPASCVVDNDCGQCGAPGHEAHACNAHKCAECSPTYACPAGKSCTPQGVCVEQCGTDGNGACSSDSDCNACGGDASSCHKSINDPVGVCGPSASGCSDLGNGVAVLPDPWDDVTNLCSNDQDCAGVGINFDVGKMLRDATGIDQINDANVSYPMSSCAAVSVGVGGNSVSCGVCVPCQVDSDCLDLDIDALAGQLFGGIGGAAASFLLDQIFGQADHIVHMYCEQVAGGYGVCSPCPGLLYECGVGGANPSSGSGSGGGSGTCDHDTCSQGGPLDGSCDDCAGTVCQMDAYCCTTAWDAQCISEAESYCGASCGGGGSSGSSGSGGGACHDECTQGGPLDASCSSCASDVCAADSYCCSTAWDDVCVNEAAQLCGVQCGQSGGGGGGQQCSTPYDCPWPEGCRADGTCGACESDWDCAPDSCDTYSGQCY
jgi:hypothetical protein